MSLTADEQNFSIGQTFSDAYPPEAAIWCNKNNAHIEEQGDGSYIIKAIPAPSLEETKARKLTEINAACDAALASLTASYPSSELLTFDKQEAEARALMADPEAATPFLTTLAAARGMTVEELAQKVIAKTDAFTAASGYVIGLRQKDEDRLKAAQTVEEVAAITPNYAIPGMG